MTDSMPKKSPCVTCGTSDKVTYIKLGANRHITYCATDGCDNITPRVSTTRRHTLETWNALQHLRAQVKGLQE